jgi:maltose phosphorylase
MEKAYKYFIQASRLDLDDYNSEIKQGLHITSMGGSWMSIVEGFAGLNILKNKVSLNTKIPPKWNYYSFKLNVKNRIINVRVDKTSTRINLLKGKNLDIILNNKKIQLTN